jgi:hypothetical protein
VHSINDISWLKVGRLPTINVEDLNSVLQYAMEVDGKVMRLVGRYTSEDEFTM